MKNIVVIYHKDCPDGFGAAWAAWKKFGNRAEYIGMEPRIQPSADFIKLLKNKEIYFLDIAYEKEVLKKILKLSKKVVIIDHHITRKEIVKFSSEYSFNINHSGAVLTWRYFHPKSPVPRLLLYVEDGDLYKFRMPYVKEINASLVSYDFDFSLWNKVAADFEDSEKTKRYVSDGRAILRYIDKAVKFLVKGAAMAIFQGHRALVVYSSIWESEVGNFIVKKEGFPMGIIWSLQKDNSVHVSLRSNKKVDVSKLAKRFGGGGHKQSAGFRLEPKQKFPWKQIKNA